MMKIHKDKWIIGTKKTFKFIKKKKLCECNKNKTSKIIIIDKKHISILCNECYDSFFESIEYVDLNRINYFNLESFTLQDLINLEK